VKKFFSKALLNVFDLRRMGRNIEGIWRKVIANAYEFLAVIFLTLRVFMKHSKRRIPIRQILMLDIALKVSRKLEENGIDYCLIGGSLLGAVRQKAFAGRPSDFDIAIKERDWQKVLSLQSEFLNLGLKTKDHTSIRLDKTKYGGIVHIWPKILRPKTRWGMIDVHVYAQVGDRWRFKYSDPELDEVPKFQILIDFPEGKKDSFGEIFGYRFPIPINSQEYLLKAFGNWQTEVKHKEYYKKLKFPG
jgi:LicD family